MTPLRRLLARHLLGILLPVVVILLGLVWWGSRSLLLDLALRDGEGRLRIAVDALDRRLDAVERVGDLVLTYWHQGRLPFNDPAVGADLLVPWLHTQRDVSLVNLLDEQGRSLLLLRDHETLKSREIRLGPSGGRELRWRELHMGAPTPEVPFHPTVYDARPRPWYQEARTLRAPRWSTPYRLEPPESRLVVTWLVPLRDPLGRVAGALGLDLLPDEFQGLLELLRPTRGSRLWVIDSRGSVLSTAQGGELPIAVPSGTGSVNLAGRTHRVLRRTIPVHAGSEWTMVLAVPEQDLLAPAQGRLLGLTAAAFALLLLPILWGLRVGQRLADAVHQLAQDAEHLGAGAAPQSPPSEVTELNILGQVLRKAHADIQDRSRLQHQLLHSQRMETLGTLAGGIAHDVNNHLGAIQGQLFLAREGLPEGHPSAQRLIRAEEAATRCAQTTRALLTFSRQGRPDLVPVDLNALLRRTAELLERVLGGLVRVELDLAPGALSLLGDRLQLEQVVMNLAVNARDAMPEGGTLTFHTQRGADGSVVLGVADRGEGIPPDLLSHIFEPFFTTKPVGKGTGLGLSIVFGIVQAHGGTIEVHSEPGLGTTFTLTFPADPAEGSAPPETGTSSGPRGPLAGLRILVAEDEGYLLETLEQALQVAGAEVVGVTTGEEAWRRYQEGDFDCVLSDQRMPGATGLDLLRRIRETGSEAPFILASGQDLEPFAAILRGDPRVQVLPKPFSIPTLVGVIARSCRP